MEQQKFLETVEKIKDMAQTDGGKISRSAIDEKLHEEGMELNESQLKMVYAYLKTSKIEVMDADVDSESEADGDAGNNMDTDADTETLEQKDDEVVKMYQADMKHVQVLSEEELLAVMKRLAADVTVKADKEAIINTFLKDVVRWVKNYSDGSVLMTDLIQEGNIGLMSAVESFDYAKAVAGDNPVKVLKQALKKAVVTFAQNAVYSQESENNVGYKISGRVNAVNDCAKELAEDLGRKVSMEEVAEKMEMTYEEIKEIVDLSSNKIEYINYY